MARLADARELEDYEEIARAEFPSQGDNFITLACSVLMIAEQLGEALDRIDRLAVRLSKLDGGDDGS